MSPKRLRNPCGQHAAARILSHWGRQAPVSALYSSHPPDTPLKLLGTSPRGLERMLRDHGLDAERVSFRREADARAWLERALPTGPVALLLDLRPLGRMLPTLHWAVATSADEAGVACEKLAGTRFDARRDLVPWSGLLRAWRAAVAPLPGYRHAAVLAAPRRAG